MQINIKMSLLLVGSFMAAGSFGCTRKAPSQNQQNAPHTKSRPSQSGVISPSVLNRLKSHERRQGVNKPVLSKAAVNGFLKKEKDALDCQRRCNAKGDAKAVCLKACSTKWGPILPKPATPKPKGSAADSASP